MKKTCLAGDECPLSRGYNAIGDWWSLLIMMRVLIADSRRFGELQCALGMAKNILTARLRKLVDEGLLERVAAADGGKHHEYVATARGRDLLPVLVTLRQWGERNCFDARDPLRYALVDAAKGQPVPTIMVRAADGRLLCPEDLRSIEVCPQARKRAPTRPRVRTA